MSSDESRHGMPRRAAQTAGLYGDRRFSARTSDEAGNQLAASFEFFDEPRQDLRCRQRFGRSNVIPYWI